ncbi:hypothetical protein FC92_GL001971 [Liquorilactobacillus hordei DSM 19519]|uniref:Uncharacterized protein n=1 Tax=Liquorilactobacillus hordei DSM 19519 TaxID=1423759 RepID=A0A0R1M746_9LACO|nr:hypothetical protein FC92_GL001971 [Liquorilactobacillus hordei DSM 19519]
MCWLEIIVKSCYFSHIFSPLYQNIIIIHPYGINLKQTSFISFIFECINCC